MLLYAALVILFADDGGLGLMAFLEIWEWYEQRPPGSSLSHGRPGEAEMLAPDE